MVRKRWSRGMVEGEEPVSLSPRTYCSRKVILSSRLAYGLSDSTVLCRNLYCYQYTLLKGLFGLTPTDSSTLSRIDWHWHSK